MSDESREFDAVRNALIQVMEKQSFRIVAENCVGDNFVCFEAGNRVVHKCLVQILNLDNQRSIKINKSVYDFKIRTNNWIALVLIIDQMSPVFYMIPMQVFEHPNEYFIDNQQPERFSHLSNWEIKIYVRMIDRLNEYLISLVLPRLKC